MAEILREGMGELIGRRFPDVAREWVMKNSSRVLKRQNHIGIRGLKEP